MATQRASNRKSLRFILNYLSNHIFPKWPHEWLSGDLVLIVVRQNMSETRLLNKSTLTPIIS